MLAGTCAASDEILRATTSAARRSMDPPAWVAEASEGSKLRQPRRWPAVPQLPPTAAHEVRSSQGLSRPQTSEHVRPRRRLCFTDLAPPLRPRRRPAIIRTVAA